MGLCEVDASAEVCTGVLSLQEMPRGTEGWSFHEMGHWHVHSFRDAEEWRGSGVGYRSDTWALMRKRKSSHGVWLRLRRIRDGAEIWCGSTHLSQGLTREKHATELHDFVDALPPTGLPVLLGGDVNTPVQWFAHGGLPPEPQSSESKGDYMLGYLKSKGILLTPPPSDQWNTPTSRPRNVEAQGRQIDVVGAKNCRAEMAHIHVDSYMKLGGDHDAVTQVVSFRFTPRKRVVKGTNRPRVVVKESVAVEGAITQEKLVALAQSSTKPRPGLAYHDPPEVKVFFQVARSTTTSEAWKRALKGRRDARKEWMKQKIAAAAQGDWAAYQTVAKKGAAGWEAHFASSLGEDKDPHVVVHDHLQEVYGGNCPPVSAFPFPREEVARADDFTAEELREALRKGKRGVAVGADKVSLELLVKVAATLEGETKLLAWFNRLLHGEERMPTDWGIATMILLPKVSLPEDPKQVRPICVGSATSKVYCRLLLERTKQALQYTESSQSMGEGRQTADYVFCVSRMMQLEQEWRTGCCFLKLDIEKAFDSLNRQVFLEKLAGKLGCNEILLNCWIMFQDTQAVLSTVWGDSVIDMVTGIRQGSVESPQMFSAVVDWILSELRDEHGWDQYQVFEGLGIGEIAFVDDLIVWDGDRDTLTHRSSQLCDALSKWGLKVNKHKCQLYISPFNKETGSVKIEGVPLKEDDHLQVMGLTFKVGITAKEAMLPLMARAKAKYWSLKLLFKAKVPLGGRLKLLHRTVGNTVLWCAAAFLPDKQALQTVNVLQAQMVIWSMRLGKREGEDWLEYRLRSFRASRWAIQRFIGIRWSTCWLQRAWDYAGHRARSSEWQPPPPSGMLDSFRHLQWWSKEQASKFGKRHPARFFPQLMGEERALDEAAKGPWRELARRKEEWRQCRDEWVKRQDLPWSSHTQLAIEV